MIELPKAMAAKPDNILAGLLAGLKPIPRLTVSEWADKYRVLSSVSSAEPGQWRNSRVPYLKEVMDRFSPYDDAREIVFMKGSQVGVTEAGFNAIGFYIDNDPCSILYAMPTEATAKRNSKIRFDPMVEASDSLRGKIAPMRSRDKQNSVLQKSFPGGVLVFCGTNSPAPLRSIPARIVVLDELDAMPADVDGEGSPVDLAKARTRTYAQRKIALISTPTVEGGSMIAEAYEKTSQKRYFVPCPHCGLMQTLEWENIRWEHPSGRDAKYLCDGCDGLIEERHKTYMLANGQWQDTKPELENPEIVGYHISALYSPLGWYSWRSAVREYLESEGNDMKRKVWTNTVLGETWKEDGEAPDWEILYNRRENYPTYRPPKSVVLITAGVDVQKDRIEVEVVGWCRGRRSYSVDYRVLVGDTADGAPGGVWDELAKMVSEKWVREDGREIPLAKMCVDAGYNTSEVYGFCRRFHPSQVVPVKGSDTQGVVLSPPRPVDRAEGKGKAVGTTALWMVGVSILKSELYGWLRLKVSESGEYPEKYCHFPTAYDAHYFRMLTAEKLQKRIVKGFPKYEWVKEYVRNEALDCRLYARAGSIMLGVDRWTEADWDAQEASYGMHQERPARREKKKSGFWDRGQ